MRKKITTLIVLAIAAFGLLGSNAASAASAGDVGSKEYETDYAVEHSMTDHDRVCYGSEDDWNGNVVGCVMPYGDILWLYDTDQDFSSVKMKWRDADGSRHGECIDDDGYGDQTRCNKNFKEGHTIKWELVWWEEGEWHSSQTYSTVV